LEILNVVLSLRERLSDLVVDASPVRGSHVDFLVVDSQSVLHLVARSVEQVVHGFAVLAAKLLRHLSQLSHALLPVVELLDGAVVLVETAFSVSILDVGVDLVLPLAEDGCVVQDQVDFLGAAFTEALALAVREWLKNDVALEGLLGLHKLLSELVEGLHEILLRIGLAHVPLLLIHLVNHRLVDVVDEGLEHANSVFGDLAEEHLLVAGAGRVDRDAGLGVTEEVESLAAKFDSIACKQFKN
jgi:hypothetical protein